MLSNLAETLHSSAQLKSKQVAKIEVSNSKNKDLVKLLGFQKVWKILLDNIKNVNKKCSSNPIFLKEIRSKKC